ncbi:hypothetical protein [Neisseria polysaccharea]|uniref:hypothetical protein n=1 Tax=Neisseria polysaccharea TaxID=489 RepID=UPI00272A9218|nr:hypothetical protein [Neisseria polysaccharea]
MKNVSLLSLFEGVGSFGSFEESFEYKQPLKVVGRDGGLEEVRYELVRGLVESLTELTDELKMPFDNEDMPHKKIMDCALTLIGAALDAARINETAQKGRALVEKDRKGWQMEKRGIRLRGGFSSKEHEQRWQEAADLMIAIKQRCLTYLWCCPTHGRSGKTQTLIRRIYQIVRYYLDIDITDYKINWLIKLYDILKPLAGLDDYPDKQTFKKHLNLEARQNIDKLLNQYTQFCTEEQNRVNRPIEERTRHAAIN